MRGWPVTCVIEPTSGCAGAYARAVFDWVAPEQVAGLPWWPPIAVIVLLIGINIVNNRVAPQEHYLLWSFGGSVLLVAVGLLDGNTWTDMGLSWRYWIPGLLWAIGCMLLITLVYLIGSLHHRTREAFHDERIGDMSGGRLAFQALIEVPFGTVVLEEVAFRAVLLSMLVRRMGLGWGLTVAAILFGLWHILPSIGTHEQNPAMGRMAGSGVRGNIVAVTLSVVTTAVSGILFAGLRLVSGSVLAPMGFHWATNGLGYGFSWFLIRARRRREGHGLSPGAE